jgi:predicted alpha/beta superfamily hydrolase
VQKFLFVLFILQISFTKAQDHSASVQVQSFSLEAPQLHTTKTIRLYLPKDYTTSQKKYPVIYMPDGQNLFDIKTAYLGEWKIDETLDRLNAQVIVVGIDHGGDKRLEELTPFANAKYGGGKGDLYLEFLVNTLKPYIDSHYRTKTNAKNTALFGSSLGGLIAFYASLKYPEIYGKVGCFSPAFWINRDPLKALMEQTPTYTSRIYLLCGDQEGDDAMETDMHTIENWINTRRCSCKMKNKSVIIPGGQHNEKLWSEQFEKAYLWLF